MQRSLKQIFAAFESDFRKFDQCFDEVMRSDIKLVDQIARYVVKHKGKQFRPALVIVSARAIAEATPATYVTAAVTELLHTATLMHDDVLDESELRRGFKTIHKVWKNKIAILMGDYLLSKSLIGATETGSLEIMNTVATVAKRLIKGAMFEIQKSRKLDLDEADYFRIVSDKTASLICACCELGALTVGATAEQRRSMHIYGENLGIAFQIKDDLLDYESNSGVLGKPALADIQDKKITLPLLYALHDSDPREKKKVIKMIRKGADKKELSYILDYVQQHDGIARAYQKAESVKTTAIRALDNIPDNEAKAALKELAAFVIERKK